MVLQLLLLMVVLVLRHSLRTVSFMVMELVLSKQLLLAQMDTSYIQTVELLLGLIQSTVEHTNK
jgi:hypothetical protein